MGWWEKYTAIVRATRKESIQQENSTVFVDDNDVMMRCEKKLLAWHGE